MLFAGAWSRTVHGVPSFIEQIVLQTGLWVPLAALFASRGMSFLFHDLYPDLLQRLLRVLSDRPVRAAAPQPSSPGVLLFGFYARIIVMQLVIIFGAFLSVVLGTIAPFALLILVKTAVDVVAHVLIDMGVVTRGAAGAMEPAAP